MPRDFNTSAPLAYFLTWTTYGTWLHGDQRGWHRFGEGESNVGEPLFEEMAKQDMKELEFVLSAEDRAVVDSTIMRHCEIRKWDLIAINVRSNHLHVVIATATHTPSQIRDQLKAWCSRQLKGHYPTRKRFWTEGASCRWINQPDDLEAAITYVNDAQD